MVEWQTRRTQNPVVAIPCGFESHLRHHFNGVLKPESKFGGKPGNNKAAFKHIELNIYYAVVVELADTQD